MADTTLVIRRGRPRKKSGMTSCANCNKKNRSFFLKCKCDKLFCTSCLLPEIHGCVQIAKFQEFSADLPKCTPSKIDIISSDA